jgi:hypothetical protein
LGKPLLFDLLDRGRIKLWSLPGSLGFVYESDAVIGEVASFAPSSDDPLKTRLGVMVGKGPDTKDLEERLFARISVPKFSEKNLVEHTRSDLTRPNFRQLLGMTPHQQANTAFHPVWDAPVINRLIAVNTARSVGAVFHVDAVQYEGGLSRVASEKDYGSMGLNRCFQTSKAFDAALRATGTPDLGQLLQRLSISELVALADTQAAQEFRDWFWQSAATLAGTGANITTEFLNRKRALPNNRLQAMANSVCSCLAPAVCRA